MRNRILTRMVALLTEGLMYFAMLLGALIAGYVLLVLLPSLLLSAVWWTSCEWILPMWMQELRYMGCVRSE